MVDIVDILDVVDVLTVLDVEVVSASIERRTISFQRATNVETLIAAVPVRVSPVSLVPLILLVSLVYVNDVSVRVVCPSRFRPFLFFAWTFRLDELYRCSLLHTLRHFVCGGIKQRSARLMSPFRLSSISLITIVFF